MTAEDALMTGLDWRCPKCKQLLGRSHEDGTCESLIRRLGHHFANAEVRWMLYGGTVVVACWKCGSEVVFRHSGGTPVI